jgi:cytochrome c5
VEKLMRRRNYLLFVLGLLGCVTITTLAQQEVRTANTTETSTSSLPPGCHGTAATHDATPSTGNRGEEKAAVESDLRIEGEKRFRANCGRCHMAPHKYPPRVMATAVRHMRVRATLTDEDMRIIRYYLTR